MRSPKRWIIRYPDELALLRKCVPELSALRDWEVQDLYEEFSQERYAGWLHVDEMEIDEFRCWVLD